MFIVLALCSFSSSYSSPDIKLNCIQKFCADLVDYLLGWQVSNSSNVYVWMRANVETKRFFFPSPLWHIFQTTEHCVLFLRILSFFLFIFLEVFSLCDVIYIFIKELVRIRYLNCLFIVNANVKHLFMSFCRYHCQHWMNGLIVTLNDDVSSILCDSR